MSIFSKRIFGFAAVVFALLVCSIAVAHTDGIYNPAANSVGNFEGIDSNAATGTVTPLTLDGTPQTAHSGASAALALPAFSTTKINDVIVVTIVTNSIAVTSVTDTNGLTFAREPALTAPNGAAGLADIWYAVAAGIQTNDVITVNLVSGAFVTAQVFAVNGAKISAPFDVSGPFTATSGAYATLTTTAANTFGIGVAVIGTSTPGVGWTNMSATALTGFLLTNTQIFSAPQTANVFDTGGTGVSIATALVRGP